MRPLSFPYRKSRKTFQDSCRRLNLDFEEIWNAYQVHDKKCEICGRHEDELRTRLHIDHCHSTNVFRGFLCSPCNTGIGLLGDTADHLSRALKYLENPL